MILGWTLLILAGAIGAAGDTSLNYWVKTQKTTWLLVAVVLWLMAVSFFVWFLSCERFSFGAAVVLALLVHAILAVVFDRLCFGGRFNPWQWAGFCCALAAIVLISIPSRDSTSASLANKLQGVRLP